MWLEKLREAKGKSGMSVKQIAEKSQISEKTVARIFAGGVSRPYLDTLGDIATVLGSSLEEIFSETHAQLATGDHASLHDALCKLFPLDSEDNLPKSSRYADKNILLVLVVPFRCNIISKIMLFITLLKWAIKFSLETVMNLHILV